MEDFDCPLCMRILLDPICTLCGHTFCKKCIISSLKLQKKCPICRAPTFIPRPPTVNVLLQTILEKNYSSELARRRQEEEGISEAEEASEIPVFALKNIVCVPTLKKKFNIFEPRYVQMIMEIVSGDRRFALLTSVKNQTISCVMELVHWSQRENDTFLIEVECKERIVINSLYLQGREPIPVENAFNEVVNNAALFYTVPQYIRDMPNTQSNISEDQLTLLRFMHTSLSTIPQHIKARLMRNLQNCTDQTFRALYLLDVFDDNFAEIYNAPSIERRLAIMNERILGLKPGRNCLRVKMHPLHMSTLPISIVMIVVIILILYLWGLNNNRVL